MARSNTALDPFLGKESLAALAQMGFGKKEVRLGPHRHHGVAARTRLSVAGKRSMASTSEHRHQHHKERVTINQVNDLAEIAREIDNFTKAGLRVPVAVWEKYDRVNKRHKKHEDMLAIAAEARRKMDKKRRAKEEQEQEEQHQGCDEKRGAGHPNQQEATTSVDTRSRRKHSAEEVLASPSSADNLSGRPSPVAASQNKPKRRTAPAPFQGGRCTFGTGRGKDEGDALETLERRAMHAPGARSGGGPSSSWGPEERQKLNEIYWDLGRPPRRGAGAEREHFFRYTQRHCMVYPNRSPAEVIDRLKLMFRYNAMKEPNEREHWRRLNAKRGFFPPKRENAATDTPESIDPGDASTTTENPQPPLDLSSLALEPEDPVGTGGTLPVSKESPAAGSEGEPLFRRSGGGGGEDTPDHVGGGLLSAAAASYAAEAIKTASLPFSPSRRPRASLRANGAISPFYDPVRPNSPAWGFGEAPPVSSSSRPGSRGGSRGDGSRGGGGSRGGPRGAGDSRDDGDDNDDRPEETELLNYTSLGGQTVSSRATSPAFTFSREGLGSENLSMFQAEKRPEPGPGSFQPNLSATSTHPGVRCGVVMGGRPGSRGGSGGGAGGGAGGVGGGGAGGDAPTGGALSTRPGPGPGQYSIWDAMGRQILSTRPSSPVVTFATGTWELR